MSSSFQTPQRNANSERPQSQNLSPTRHLSGHCVCEICTCNHHRCPPKQIGYAPDLLQSTMKKDYPAYQVQRQGRGKQQPYVPTNYGPGLMQTTAQADYTPKKLNKPEERAKQGYAPCSVPFNGESEYKNSYLKNEVPVQRAGKIPQKTYNSGIPFNAESTYADNFKGQQGPRERPQTCQEKRVYNTPFTGSSSYQQDYQKFDVPRNNNGHKPQFVPNNVPFEGNSSYKQDYKNFDPSLYQNRHCPVEDLPQRPRNCSPGKTHLYYHDENRNWD